MHARRCHGPGLRHFQSHRWSCRLCLVYRWERATAPPQFFNSIRVRGIHRPRETQGRRLRVNLNGGLARRLRSRAGAAWPIGPFGGSRGVCTSARAARAGHESDCSDPASECDDVTSISGLRDQSIYNGELNKGLRHGRGTMKFTNQAYEGDRYDGE